MINVRSRVDKFESTFDKSERGAKSTERVIWLRQDPSAACAAREVSDMAVGPGKIHRSIQKYTKTHRDTQKQAEIHRKTCPIVSQTKCKLSLCG